MFKKILDNKYLFIIGLINLILDFLFYYYIYKLNILPIKYLIVLVIILIIYLGLIVLFSILKNKIFKIISTGLTIILLILTITVIKYSNITSNFLNKHFSNLDDSYENKYLVISKEKYDNLNKLENKKIGYYITMPNYDKAINTLDIPFEKIEFEDTNTMINALKEDNIDAFVIDKILYNYISESEQSNLLSEYKILYDYSIKVKEETILESNTKDIFNLYVGGLDFTETNTDFNLIITINRNTHKILLTSIPRDYYVDIYRKDGKDILGYAGVWGVNTSVKTVENLFEIPIDYFMRIHTNNLVDLVDILGGVEFCSNYSFYTTHAMILGSYDDTTGKHLYVESGCHEYNGIEILTIARERLQIGGDRQRQKNCQDILINILKKIASGDILSKYEQVLNSLGNTYTTNISKDVITAIIRDTIDNPSVWEFMKQSVDGYSTSGKVHFSNYYDSVMEPDVDTINSAKEKIKEVMN